MIPAFLLKYLITAGVVSALIFGVWLHGNAKGRASINAKWEAAITAERVRVQKANDAAIAEAEKKVTQLLREREAQDDLIEELKREADADVHAARPSLSAGGVQRLNRIK